jgi:hypothetical protein
VTGVKRFNAEGIAGLEDKPKAGRPPILDQRVRGDLINLAHHKPDTLVYPFKLWTLRFYKRPSKTTSVSISLARPFENGAKARGSKGTASRVGSTKPRNMIRSSQKREAS